MFALLKVYSNTSGNQLTLLPTVLEMFIIIYNIQHIRADRPCITIFAFAYRQQAVHNSDIKAWIY